MKISFKPYPFNKFFKIIYFLFFTLLLLGQPYLLHSFAPELNRINQSQGIKYFTNYLPREHEFHPQNWWILQDKQGIIYVANQGGLLEFDGVNWKTISIPNNSVRSIALAEDTGRIYIGGNNEIGCVIPDSNGSFQYVSLLQHLESDKKNFANVWQTLWTKEGVYFRTSKFLFRWNSRDMKIWQTRTTFRALFYFRGKLFVQQDEPGLMQMLKNKLVLVPDGKTFSHKKICMMAPYPDETSDAGKLLIATWPAEFYLYDGIRASAFSTEIDSYLEKAKISHGIALSSSPGSFALGTHQGGLMIINSQGRLEQIYDKKYGLQDQDVKYVYEDSSGNIWLGLGKGISKIEHNSPISIYDDRANLNGLVLSVARHGPQKDLYVGTTTGLYILPSTASSTFNGNDKFYPVPGIQSSCWSLLSTGDSLLAASTLGVFQVKNTSKKIIEEPSYILQPSQQKPQRIWVGTANGIISLHREKGQWVEEQNLQPVTEAIRSIVENKKGELWLGTLSHGVLKVKFSRDKALTKPAVTVKGYDTSQGLPTGEVYIFMAAGHVMTATRKGIFRFNEKNNSFVPDFTLGKEFAGGARGVFRIAEDQNKHIWFHSSNRNYEAIPQSDGSFIINNKPFLRIHLVQVNAIYPDPGGDIIWFASHDGLVRYNKTVKKKYQYNFPVLICKVLVNEKPIFNGHKEKRDSNSKIIFPIFSYKERNLHFKFAAVFFEAETKTRYHYFLEGYDDNWSAWTGETKKDYTNLDAGKYTFRVQAKNVYGNLSQEDSFSFRILPPWYKTWWAFLIYGLTALLLMFLVVKWRSWKLEQEKLKLEHIIKQRTKEIDDKNRQLQRKTLQLEEQSEKLKEMDQVKSRFFANISHEFRTPLTLIMGPLEQILSDNPGKEMEAKANLMLRNSRRLLNLINQLLELAKFESGKMQLDASLQDIIPYIKNIVMCFESLALQKKADLVFQGYEQHITVYFDPEKLEIIITNLLANAFNYLPGGGKITVSVRRVAGIGSFPTGFVEISVRDTGPGIPKDQLPHIFDRFYRGTASRGADRKGSGIGLALSRDLVELHHGEIQVQSSCFDHHNRGTEFIIRLPLGKEQLQPGEILDPGDTGTVNHDVLPQPETDKNNEQQEPIVLVVEDNPIERLFIKVTLENQFKVIEAADGKEGILRAREIIPDLIVSDIIMPVTDGYELCRTLKQDVLTSHIPIILLTVKGSEESVLQGLETGADDYITKPFSKSLLMARAGNLLELRRQLQLERKNRMTLQPEKITISPMDDEFYKTLQDTVETHLSDPDFNVEALGRVLQMSQATLYRKIHALTGKTPTSFIRSYRIKRAAQLLEAHAGNVSEVADKVGFLDKSYFAMCFKEQFHCLPSDIKSSEVSETVDEDADSQREDNYKLQNTNKQNSNVKKSTNEKFLRGAPGGAVFSKSAPPGRRRQEIILLVEDSEDARYFIRESLEPEYRVVEAVDGSEGIARAVEIVPDLIISDIMMPEVDGYELCRVLKRDVRTSHIPIVLLTAKVSEESIIQGLETGADDYITKPFNTKILHARLKNLIHLRSHLHKSRDREMALLPGKISESEIDREFMKELNAIIEKNLSDPEFNVDRLAKKLYMSRLTLYRKILAISGETPTEFIRSHRLKRGAQLLESNFGSVLEVAFEVGFSNSSYFAKCFKDVFHQSPSDYQAAKTK